MEKKIIDIQGHRIATLEVGQGDKVAFVLHGWGTNIESVMGIVNALKDRYRVIAYEAYGHGESDDPKELIGTQDYADLVGKVMDYFGVERASFLGHSFGGKTLTIFAAQHPHRVDQLVLIDASGVHPKRGLDYYGRVYTFKALRWIYQRLFFWKEESERLRGFYSKFGSEDYQASQGIMRQVFVKVVNEDTFTYFPKIQAETLLIWGRDDEATPLYMAREFEDKIPNAGLVLLEGGHYAYAEDYGTFQAVLRSFMKG
ncbi:MAG: alpha/beta hydrolase [Tissierellia bacterium]|nr:alpha/beta hydrolase [Tissierellia bacterium]